MADLWDRQLRSESFGRVVAAVTEPSPDLMDRRLCAETWQLGFV